MLTLNVGDKVAFTTAVCAHIGTPQVKQAQGVVVGIISPAGVRVDFQGTWDSEDGRMIRAVPIANLRKVN